MKVRNTILVTALVVLVAIAGVGAWLYSSLDSLVASAINSYGPEIVGAKFHVAGVKIAPASGQGSIEGLVIGNPPGFKTDHALKADHIAIEIDPSTVTDDVVVIRKIEVVAPQVTYESGSDGSNFDALQRNAARYVKEKVGDSGGKKEGPGKKIIIEHLSIRDAKASVSSPLLAGKSLTVPLPDIKLNNIGKDKHGIPPGEAGSVIASALTQKVTGAATEGIRNIAKQGVEAVSQGVAKAQSGVKSLFGGK